MLISSLRWYPTTLLAVCCCSAAVFSISLCCIHTIRYKELCSSKVTRRNKWVLWCTYWMQEGDSVRSLKSVGDLFAYRLFLDVVTWGRILDSSGNMDLTHLSISVSEPKMPEGGFITSGQSQASCFPLCPFIMLNYAKITVLWLWLNIYLTESSFNHLN